jgi:predicted amidophosphoribosyltransferase
MSSARPANPGKSRQCPHCKATILDSASVCPGCRHHLRFDSVVIRDHAGLEVTRQVVGVGALQPAEERSFSLSVEVFGRAEIVPTLKSINKK